MTRPGLTLEQLAARRGLHPDAMLALLEDTARLGLCEQDTQGRWRLTPHAEREYGAALRELTLTEDRR